MNIPTSRNKSPLARAFTLVELLTVAAIVVILAALLIPAIQALRSSADSAKCVGNLRQIGVLMHLYIQDHNGWAPPHWGRAFNSVDTTEPFMGWAGRLAPYLEENSYNSPISKIFTCPSDPDRKAWPAIRSYIRPGVPGIPASAETYADISYGYNYATFTSAWGFLPPPANPDDPPATHNTRRFTKPSKVILVADSKPLSQGGLDRTLIFWFNPNLRPGQNHRGSFNALFLDGHAQWMPYETATQSIPYWAE